MGLMLVADPSLKGSPSALIDRLRCNATNDDTLADLIGGGGDVLNVDAAVRNTNACP